MRDDIQGKRLVCLQLRSDRPGHAGLEENGEDKAFHREIGGVYSCLRSAKRACLL